MGKVLHTNLDSEIAYKYGFLGCVWLENDRKIQFLGEKLNLLNCTTINENKSPCGMD